MSIGLHRGRITPPLTATKLPDNREKRPNTRGELPHTREEVPNRGEEVAHARGELPSIRQKVSHTRGELPSLREELPNNRGKTPTNREELPNNPERPIACHERPGGSCAGLLSGGILVVRASRLLLSQRRIAGLRRGELEPRRDEAHEAEGRDAPSPAAVTHGKPRSGGRVRDVVVRASSPALDCSRDGCTRHGQPSGEPRPLGRMSPPLGKAESPLSFAAKPRHTVWRATLPLGPRASGRGGVGAADEEVKGRCTGGRAVALRRMDKEGDGGGLREKNSLLPQTPSFLTSPRRETALMPPRKLARRWPSLVANPKQYSR